MLEPYVNAVFISEVIAAIFGTVFYFKYKNTPFRYMVFVLWYIVLTETLGLDYINKELGLYYTDKNGVFYDLFLYNLLSLIIFPVFYYMYYKTLNNKTYKILIKIFIGIFLFSSIVNWVFFQNFLTEWINYPKIIGSVFLTICVIFYFIELLQSNKIISFQRLVPFWISVGMLVFYTSTIPFTVVQNSYMLSSEAATKNMFIIKLVLATAMYLVFTFGFIWSKKE